MYHFNFKINEKVLLIWVLHYSLFVLACLTGQHYYFTKLLEQNMSIGGGEGVGVLNVNNNYVKSRGNLKESLKLAPI